MIFFSQLRTAYFQRTKGHCPMQSPRLVRLALLSLSLLAAPSLLHAQQTLDNAAILKLAKSGLSESLIVQTITASPGHYDTGTDALIALKKAGITDNEVGAMLMKNANPNGPATPTATASGPSLPAGVDEIGVYYKDTKTGSWVEFKPEIVNYKSGGVLKSIATDGIVKGDKNGHIPGKSAELALSHPLDILIYAPEGTAPNEYQLLKLRQNSNNREFRSETGGVFHNSGGADRDRQDFTATKIGTRLYTFTIGPETKPGEYGILPPGAISSTNAASAGKINTFRLLE
jgi:hypothetical protein